MEMDTQQPSVQGDKLAVLLEQAHKKGTEEELTTAQMIDWLAGELKK
ncbi:hypothetical protein [Jeotgalibacillus proteolyticus]|nr:hypothetical protein [Jeotgalibacillus proteolyticus]